MPNAHQSISPEDVLTYWLEELGPSGWYSSDDAIDAHIRAAFGALWEEARAGGLLGWSETPEATLAFLILTDQFPRNMFRGDGRSFATDQIACAASLRAIELGFDQKIAPPARQFFYMPFMHSECLTDQDLSVTCFETKMGGENTNILHAKVHREVIREFGRFPYRNEALGRPSSEKEALFIEEGGYGFALRQFDQP